MHFGCDLGCGQQAWWNRLSQHVPVQRLQGVRQHAVLRRRPEAYHETLRAHDAKADGTGEDAAPAADAPAGQVGNATAAKDTIDVQAKEKS